MRFGVPAGRARRGHPGIARVCREEGRPRRSSSSSTSSPSATAKKEVLDGGWRSYSARRMPTSGWCRWCQRRCLSTSARRTASRSRSAAAGRSSGADWNWRTSSGARGPARGARLKALRNGHILLNADEAGRRSSPARGPTSGWRPTCPMRRTPVLPHGRRLVRDRRRLRPRLPRRDRPALPRHALDLPPWSLSPEGTRATTTQRRVRPDAYCAWTGTRRSGIRSGVAQPAGDLRPARPGQRAHPRQAGQGIRAAQPPVLPGPHLGAEPALRPAPGTRAVPAEVGRLGKGRTLPGGSGYAPRKSSSRS